MVKGYESYQMKPFAPIPFATLFPVQVEVFIPGSEPHSFAERLPRAQQVRKRKPESNEIAEI
jgi:hypothetical protein